jgi:hypothetical protein
MWYQQMPKFPDEPGHSVFAALSQSGVPGVPATSRTLLTQVMSECQRLPIWLILASGEPLKTIDLSAMLLPQNVAGGGTECRLRHCFLYQKGWK